MPSPEKQKRWVGDHGVSLMSRSCSVIRLFDILSWRTTGAGLNGKRILGYGCGWGRLLRLMNYYSDVANVVGVDPMQDSLDACAQSEVPNKVWRIDTRPSPDEPHGAGSDFDFVYLFSVFSHTPEEVTLAILRKIARMTTSDAVVVGTIRTIEWVSVRQGVWAEENISALKRTYEATGYGFVPISGDKNLARADYGDTIMTPDYYAKLVAAAGWKIAAIDRDVLEPFQICVALKKI